MSSPTEMLAVCPPCPQRSTRYQMKAFELILEDVTFYGLSQAVTRILYGKAGLTHDHAPSPKESRTTIDAVMAPFIEAERRARQIKQQLEERPAKACGGGAGGDGGVRQMSHPRQLRVKDISSSRRLGSRCAGLAHAAGVGRPRTAHIV